jgi:hypothetical protein
MRPMHLFVRGRKEVNRWRTVLFRFCVRDVVACSAFFVLYKTSYIRRLFRYESKNYFLAGGLGGHRYRLNFGFCNCVCPRFGPWHLPSAIGNCQFFFVHLSKLPSQVNMPTRCHCTTCVGAYVCRRTFVSHGSRHEPPDHAAHEVLTLNTLE